MGDVPRPRHLWKCDDRKDDPRAAPALSDSTARSRGCTAAAWYPANAFVECSFGFIAPGKVNAEITGYVDTKAYDDYLVAADLSVQLHTSSRGETSRAVLDFL